MGLTVKVEAVVGGDDGCGELVVGRREGPGRVVERLAVLIETVGEGLSVLVRCERGGIHASGDKAGGSDA